MREKEPISINHSAVQVMALCLILSILYLTGCASMFTVPTKVVYQVTTPDGTLVISYSGIVSGDTFSGTVNLGGLAEAPYTGVRIMPAEGKTTRE